MKTSLTTKTSNDACVQALLAQIRKYSVLSAEEEREAFIAYANGDKRQRDRILNSNLRFVFSYANHMANGTAKVLDYFSEMSIAYCKAFDDYKLEMGFRFLSFAVQYMDNIRTEVYSNESLVKRTYARLFANKANKIREKFLAVNEREATDEEVAEILESQGHKVADISYIAKGGFASLSDSASADEDADEAGEVGTLALIMSDSNEYEREIERENNEMLVATLMSCLPTRDKEITRRVILNSEDKESVGNDFSMSAERVRQIVEGSLKRMRATAESKGIKWA